MSDQRIAELYERLIAAKFKTVRPRIEYPFHLGWNAAIDQAIELLKLTCDESETQEPAE